MSKIDYDLRLIRGVAFDVDGVLSPSTVPMSEQGEPMRMVNIKDGYAMQFAVKCGLRIAIITGARSTGIIGRYNALGIHDIFLGASDKLPVLAQWMSTNGLKKDEVAFVGDDIPDLPCLKAVGLPVTPADGAVEARMAARYISDMNGGYGVARDILEEVLKARGEWLSQAKAFGW